MKWCPTASRNGRTRPACGWGPAPGLQIGARMRTKRWMAGAGVLFLGAAILSAAVAAVAPAEQFYAVIRANDLTALRALVRAGVAGVHDRRGVTPLMYAAAVGSVD